MIVWFNCKITDDRLNPQNIVRFNLRNDNRFDVARYSFASFEPLIPLVSRFIFNLELADQHRGREAEMESWLRSIFPQEKLVLHWYRRDTIAQWKELQKEIQDLDDDLIFPAGNEDHIFLDSTAEVFAQGLKLISQDPDPYAVLMTSHWPESIRAAYVYQGQLSDCANYVCYNMPNNDAIRVMKRSYFDQYIESVRDESMTLFRTEQWNSIGLANNKIYVPTKEQFRHFDGYAHVQVGPEVCPPMEIPPNFFNGMTIRYGFSDRNNNCLNVNPATIDLHTVNQESGTDYKFVLSEFPAFWQRYTKELVQNPNIKSEDLDAAYDTYLLDLTRIYINWYHVGQIFNETNWPPATWLNNHTKKYLFTDE